jgi:hypothetical protein
MSMNGKCVGHLDQAILDSKDGGKDIDMRAVPNAVVNVPMVKQFNVAGQVIAAPVMLEVCLECRVEQIKPMSKSGLITS